MEIECNQIKIVEEGNFIYVGEKVDGEVSEMKVINLEYLLIK